MTVGWIQLDITYEEATDDDYNYTAPVFNDDEDQTRWFYFKSNGKKVYADDDERTKDRTINGRKYAFDEFGTMVAEWSLDAVDPASYNDSNDEASNSNASPSAVIKGQAADAKYTELWKYFSSVEDGARVSKGWFKVVPAEYLNEESTMTMRIIVLWRWQRYLYAGEFKTINGKKYAFRDDGRMVDSLKFIYEDEDYQSLDVRSDDDDYYRFDSEDDFDENAPLMKLVVQVLLLRRF